MAISYSDIDEVNVYKYTWNDPYYNLIYVCHVSGTGHTASDICTDWNDVKQILLNGGNTVPVLGVGYQGSSVIAPSYSNDYIKFSHTSTDYIGGNCIEGPYSSGIYIPDTSSDSRQYIAYSPIIIRYVDDESVYYDMAIYLNRISSTSIATFPDNGVGHALIDATNQYMTNYTGGGENNVITSILGIATIYDPNNAYPGGDESENPGDGHFDYNGDAVPIPDLPTISVADTGFVTLFAPTENELKNLSSFLWSEAFSLDSFKKIFNNPMDCILGLSIVPVNIPTAGSREITVGNIVSTVSCTVAAQQFIEVDCGTLTITSTKLSASYLDYSPYLKTYIYLPFIGVQQLNTDDIMNTTIHVVYHVDILTGACVCYIEVTNRKNSDSKLNLQDAVLYTYMGQCAESVPLSSASYSNTVGSILGAAASIGAVAATAVTGGAAAPVAASLLTGAVSSTANAAASLKPSIQRSGSLGGSSGFMNTLYPYLIFDCPHTSMPIQQYKYTGYPSNAIIKLSKLSGFNVIQAINLSIDGANDAEMSEIDTILKSGVIL